MLNRRMATSFSKDTRGKEEGWMEIGVSFIGVKEMGSSGNHWVALVFRVK